MARIRTIKPDFFQSEDVAELGYRARLTWIGLWTHVDDEGRCKDSARLIKGQLWPLEDDVTAADVESDLKELEGNGQIIRYEVDGDKFIQIRKWLKHQRISRPTPSRLPTPHGTLTEDSVSPHANSEDDERGVHESSAVEGEREVEREREVEGGKRTAPHPIPADFTVTEDMHQWAALQAPAVSIERETNEFVDYWRGTGKKKADWTRTWKNRISTKQTDMEARGWKPKPSHMNPSNW